MKFNADFLANLIPDEVKNVAESIGKLLSKEIPYMKTKIENMEKKLENIEKMLEDKIKDGRK